MRHLEGPYVEKNVVKAPLRVQTGMQSRSRSRDQSVGQSCHRDCKPRMRPGTEGGGGTLIKGVTELVSSLKVGSNCHIKSNKTV